MKLRCAQHVGPICVDFTSLNHFWLLRFIDLLTLCCEAGLDDML